MAPSRNSLVSLSDRDLVVAFQAGTRAAYEEVYRRYAPRVRRVCGRILTNPQDAEEATQETFLKAYQAMHRFNGSYQLGAWLARIAANVCVDHVRGRGRSAHLVALAPEHDILGAEGGPEELVAGSDPRVDETIDSIQPLHAQALKLRALGGLSHEEMAGRLGMTPAQVKALLHRARTSFKRAWSRAEGWLVAPLVGFRTMLHGREDNAHTSSNLVGATGSFSPLLAERMAASAMIVVVALSGAPSVPQGGSQDDVTTATVSDIPRPAKAHALARSHAAAARAAGAPAEAGSSEALLHDHVVSLLGRESGTLRPRDDDGDDGDGDDGDEDVRPAEVRPVVKKIRQIVREVTGGLKAPEND